MARHSPAPISYIPHELLEKIFNIGARLPVPTDERYPHRPLFSRMPYLPPYAIILSQVCIRWRETVLHMPIVWSYIHLTRSLDSHRRLKSHIRRSLEWLPKHLALSRNLPLHITLDTTRLPVDATLSLIFPYSTRWGSFTLLVSHVGSLPPILPLLTHTRVPCLRYLSITSDIYREGIVCYDPLVPFFTSGTPQLTTIRLTGVYVAWNALPLANLQALELHFTSRWPIFLQLQDMFDSSPRLQRLVIHDDIASILRHVDQPPSRPTVDLSTLKYLEIEVFRIREERVDVVGLLQLFSLPILQVLTIKNITFDEWLAVTDRYDLPVSAFPGQGFADLNRPERYSSHRLPLSFPFLSSLTITNKNTMRPLSLIQ